MNLESSVSASEWRLVVFVDGPFNPVKRGQKWTKNPIVVGFWMKRVAPPAVTLSPAKIALATGDGPR